jgi:hypothetical protein
MVEACDSAVNCRSNADINASNAVEHTSTSETDGEDSDEFSDVDDGSAVTEEWAHQLEVWNDTEVVLRGIEALGLRLYGFSFEDCLSNSSAAQSSSHDYWPSSLPWTPLFSCCPLCAKGHHFVCKPYIDPMHPMGKFEVADAQQIETLEFEDEVEASEIEILLRKRGLIQTAKSTSGSDSETSESTERSADEEVMIAVIGRIARQAGMRGPPMDVSTLRYLDRWLRRWLCGEFSHQRSGFSGRAMSFPHAVRLGDAACLQSFLGQIWLGSHDEVGWATSSLEEPRITLLSVVQTLGRQFHRLSGGFGVVTQHNFGKLRSPFRLHKATSMPSVSAEPAAKRHRSADSDDVSRIETITNLLGDRDGSTPCIAGIGSVAPDPDLLAYVLQLIKSSELELAIDRDALDLIAWTLERTLGTLLAQAIAVAEYAGQFARCSGEHRKILPQPGAVRFSKVLEDDIHYALRLFGWGR